MSRFVSSRLALVTSFLLVVLILCGSMSTVAGVSILGSPIPRGHESSPGASLGAGTRAAPSPAPSFHAPAPSAVGRKLAVPGSVPRAGIDPTLGYSREPAPMGIADFGVSGSQNGASDYQYASSAFEGNAFVRSMNLSVSGHGATLHVTAFELNAVLVLRLNGTNYSYWIQNGLHVNTSSRQFTIGGAYVWNFSAVGAHLSSSEVRGNFSSVLASDTYYFIPGCGVFSGQCGTLSWPGNVTGRLVSSTAGGVPFVDYQYDLGSGWVTYDNVSFLHMAGATDVGFVVDGFHATPISSNEFYDAEWVWVAAGGGSSGVVQSSDLVMSLDFWNGLNFQAVPTAWDFGGDTGETSSNVTEMATEGGPDGAPASQVSNGAGSLGILYNQTGVGFLNLTIPSNASQTLLVNGTPITIPHGSVNLTLNAGSYPVALQNFSNATQRITIPPGSTDYVNLSGAGEVAFRENGLPAGTSWGITLGGVLRTSTAPTIVFNVPNATYLLSFTSVAGFYRNSTEPSSLIVPTTSSVEVSWSPFTYNVPFTEEGLPSLTTWWIEAGGAVQSGNGTTIEVPAPNGSTPFTIGSTYDFVADPSSGWINVTHGLFAPVAVVFSYRPTFIVGTVSPQGASVAIDGVLQAVTDGTFNDSVLPGAHTLVVNDTGYTPQTIHVNATAGNYTVVHVRLIPLPSPGSVSTTNTSSTGLSSVELGALIAVIGVAIAAGIGLLIWRRTKNP